MYLNMYLFVPDPVQNLVPGGRYKVLRSTLYRGVGTKYSKVPCTGEQVQGTWKYLVPTNRYKVWKVPCTSGTRYCTWHSSDCMYSFICFDFFLTGGTFKAPINVERKSFKEEEMPQYFLFPFLFPWWSLSFALFYRCAFTIFTAISPQKIFSKGLHKITPEIYQMNYKKQQL